MHPKTYPFTPQSPQAFHEKQKAAAPPMSIYVVVEEGYVKQVVGLPERAQVTVLDYDVEEDDGRQPEPSPLDGELCFITKF